MLKLKSNWQVWLKISLDLVSDSQQPATGARGNNDGKTCTVHISTYNFHYKTFILLYMLHTVKPNVSHLPQVASNFFRWALSTVKLEMLSVAHAWVDTRYTTTTTPQTCWLYFHFTDHCITLLCNRVRLCVYVTGHYACQQPASCHLFFVPVATKAFSDRTEKRNTPAQMDRVRQCVTLIISLRCDSGSRPAIGRILIFCVLEQRSARDRVIFLWVALSVEWGLGIQKKHNVIFKVSAYFPSAF